MKDEIPNDTIIEAFFLKAKAFCYITAKGEEEKKLNGITEATVKNKIDVEDCKDAVYQNKTFNYSVISII